MRESSPPRVLLVRAIEEADRTGALIPLGDRERAAREALRAAGAAAGDGADRRFPPPSGARAGRPRLPPGRPLLERHPVLRDILVRSRSPGWTGLAMIAAAFAFGLALSALDGSRRINILAPPVLGLLAWNLLVYLALAVGAARRLGSPRAARRPLRPLRGPGCGAPPRPAADPHLGGRLPARRGRAPLRSRLGGVGRPALGQHLRRWLHLGAAAVPAGIAAGLYLRGLVLRYEAGWESTFLEPPQVKTLIGLLFGRAAALAGIPLPQTLDEVARLRWDAAGGGGPAAPWIHLIALVLAALVVVPRLALAGAAWLAGGRLQRAGHLPPQVVAYARAALGAGGDRTLAVGVTPYAFEPPPGAAAEVAKAIARAFGSAARPDLRPAIAYGDEGAIAAAFDADAHRVGARVLLMNLASTPETENHGAAIVAARDHARRARPPLPLLVVVDESAYAARFPPAGESAGRLEERRRLWREFAASHGVEAAFTGDAPTCRGRGSDVAAIDLCLISHTNVGKTTLARTLLRRDVGDVRDEAHVTGASTGYTLIESPEGDALRIWDTPGFGDSARLLRRLEGSGNPLGWLLSQVWDRFADRPFFSSQAAVRTVREEADLVLYLVNAAEDPAGAGYLEPEMRIVGWTGKPTLVLLNQLGAPRPAAEERAEAERWADATSRPSPGCAARWPSTPLRAAGCRSTRCSSAWAPPCPKRRGRRSRASTAPGARATRRSSAAGRRAGRRLSRSPPTSRRVADAALGEGARAWRSRSPAGERAAPAVAAPCRSSPRAPTPASAGLPTA